MKKLLIVILIGLAFLLASCSDVKSVNENVDGYISVKYGHFNNVQVWVFDENNYVWYDESKHGALVEVMEVYIYKSIDVIPFYLLITNETVQLYSVSNFYFIEARDVKTIKIEG